MALDNLEGKSAASAQQQKVADPATMVEPTPAPSQRPAAGGLTVAGGNISESPKVANRSIDKATSPLVRPRALTLETSDGELSDRGGMRRNARKQTSVPKVCSATLGHVIFPDSVHKHVAVLE